MAFDYKSLQATVSARPPATDGYCPECGQSLTPAGAAPVDKPSSGPWWSWVLIAVGVYLVVAAGLRAWNDYQLAVRMRDSLDDVVFAMQDVRSGGSAKQLLADTQGQLNSNLVVGAGGLALVLLGLGAGARRRLIRGYSAHNSVSSVLLGVWGSGETLVISAVGLVLLTFSYLVVSELVVAKPLSLALIDSAASRTFDLIIFIVNVVPGR